MEHTDEITLRVGSKTPVAELAAAISHGIYGAHPVTLRAIGAGAVNQAVKAAAVARGMVAPRGLNLALIPGFTTISMPDGDVTGQLLKVIVI